jgi:hypothetical protein
MEVGLIPFTNGVPYLFEVFIVKKGCDVIGVLDILKTEFI